MFGNGWATPARSSDPPRPPFLPSRQRLRLRPHPAPGSGVRLAEGAGDGRRVVGTHRLVPAEVLLVPGPRQGRGQPLVEVARLLPRLGQGGRAATDADAGAARPD